MSRFSCSRRALCAVAFITALAPAALAQTRAGVLQCDLSGGIGLVVVENQALDCVFQDDIGSPPAHYVGKLTNVGANIGVSGPGQLVWVVLAGTEPVAPGALAGDYVGPEGSLAVGVAGGGGAVLVGGAGRAFALQPVSIQVGTGLNLSAGIGNVTLLYAPEAPPPSYGPPPHVRAAPGRPKVHPQILPPPPR